MPGGRVRELLAILRRVSPELRALPFRVRFVTDLEAKLGKPVHAGANIRTREVLLDAELAGDGRELARIFLHEAFHFAWVRLGNPRRREYETLLEAEFRARARGEMGWSAEVRKRGLAARDRAERTRKWREYVCESFCDTGAWVYGRYRRHGEWTLAGGRRKRRAECLVRIIEEGGFLV